MRILWINPVGTTAFDDPLGDELERLKRPGTEVEVRSLRNGPSHLEYHAYEAEVMPELLRTIASAEGEGFDAAVIGCFYDTGLRPAREVAQRLAVAAPCEASLHIAASLGNTFSILGVTRKTIPEMHDNVRRYGFGDRLASFRVLGMSVDEFHVDPGLTSRRLIEDARVAVEADRAEVLILGCTIQHGFNRVLQEEVGVPVVDPVVAGFKYAELLGDLARFGWTTSKVGGYKSPPPNEVERFGLGALLPRPFAAA